MSTHLSLPFGISMFEPEPGSRSTFDILPYVVKNVEAHPDREFLIGARPLWYRYSYGAHRTADGLVTCPRNVGETCPTCDLRARLIEEGLSWKDERVPPRMSNRVLHYVNVDPGRGKKPDIRVWDTTPFVFEDALMLEINDREEDEFAEQVDNFASLEDGLILRVKFSREFDSRTGKAFPKTSRIDFEHRDYSYDERIIEALPALEDLLVYANRDPGRS